MKLFTVAVVLLSACALVQGIEVESAENRSPHNKHAKSNKKLARRKLHAMVKHHLKKMKAKGKAKTKYEVQKDKGSMTHVEWNTDTTDSQDKAAEVRVEAPTGEIAHMKMFHPKTTVTEHSADSRAATKPDGTGQSSSVATKRIVETVGENAAGITMHKDAQGAQSGIAGGNGAQ